MNSCLQKIVLSLGMATSVLGAAALPAAAQMGISIHLGPQPPPRHEMMGRPPRHGCHWIRGHYVPRHNRWVWIPGHWNC